MLLTGRTAWRAEKSVNLQLNVDGVPHISCLSLENSFRKRGRPSFWWNFLNLSKELSPAFQATIWAEWLTKAMWYFIVAGCSCDTLHFLFYRESTTPETTSKDGMYRELGRMWIWQRWDFFLVACNYHIFTYCWVFAVCWLLWLQLIPSSQKHWK